MVGCCGRLCASLGLGSKPKAREPDLTKPGEEPKEVETKHVTKLQVSEETVEQVNQYHMNQLLGRGAYGSVYQATDDRGELVAVKVLDRSLLKRKPMLKQKAIEDQMREIAVMKRLNHPHCVKLFEVIDDSEHDRLFLVLELLQGRHVLHDDNLPPNMTYLPEACARVVFRELLLGLEYLHGNGILHRDIKPENLVFVEPPPWSKAQLQKIAKARIKPGAVDVADLASAAGEQLVDNAVRESGSRPQESSLGGDMEAFSGSLLVSLAKPIEKLAGLLTGESRYSDGKRATGGELSATSSKETSSKLTADADPVAEAKQAPPRDPARGQHVFRTRSRGGNSRGTSSSHGSSAVDPAEVGLTINATGSDRVPTQGQPAPGPNSSDTYMLRLLEGRDHATLKLLDFGVSQICEVTTVTDSQGQTAAKSDDIIAKATGTPAFYSPEMCVKGGYHGVPADIWATGVTLCMLTGGALPFDGPPSEIFRLIQEEEPVLPEHASSQLRELLLRLLTKDPTKRVTWSELRQDPWVTVDGKYPLPSNVTLQIQVSEEEVQSAISVASFGNTVNVIMFSKKLKHKISDKRLKEGAGDSPKNSGENSNASYDSAGAGSGVADDAPLGSFSQPLAPVLEVGDTLSTSVHSDPHGSATQQEPHESHATAPIAAADQGPPIEAGPSTAPVSPPDAQKEPLPAQQAVEKPLPRHPAMLRKG